MTGNKFVGLLFEKIHIILCSYLQLISRLIRLMIILIEMRAKLRDEEDKKYWLFKLWKTGCYFAE